MDALIRKKKAVSRTRDLNYEKLWEVSQSIHTYKVRTITQSNFIQYVCNSLSTFSDDNPMTIPSYVMSNIPTSIITRNMLPDSSFSDQNI